MSLRSAGEVEHPDSLGGAFSSLLVATFITNLGDGLRLAALPLLAATLTTSPLLIGGLTAAQFLPWLTFGPFGGVIVDRSDRRRLIMITQIWRSALMALLGIAVLTDFVQIWQLFIVAFLITLGEILVDPSVVATVPKLVARDDLDRANGRITTIELVTNNFAGGPIGAATFAIAPWLPLLLNSLSYVGSVVPFRHLPPTRSQPIDGAARPADRAALGDGLRWLEQHSFLGPLTVAMAVYHVGTGGALGLLVLLVTDVLDASGLAFGVVLAAAAVGATVASLFASRLTAAFTRRTVMAAGAATAACSVLAASAATSEWQLVAAWTINGAANGTMLAIGRGFIQRHTPNDRLGRTAIASRTITRTSFVIGALLAGAVADSTSVRWSFVVAGLFHLVGAVLLWRSFRHEPS